MYPAGGYWASLADYYRSQERTQDTDMNAAEAATIIARAFARERGHNLLQPSKNDLRDAWIAVEALVQHGLVNAR